MDPVAPKVFISVGSAATPAERRASEVIFSMLETVGLSPRQMEKNEWSPEQPLRGIRRIIEQCSGIVVIAFPRYRFSSGTERLKDSSEKPLNDVCFTTVWNQIEAAMGYTRDLPLLVIAEHGLNSDGLLEDHYDWKVIWTDFSVDELQSERFLGYLRSWKKLVINAETSKATPMVETVKPAELTLGKIWEAITLPQLWAILSALATCAAAIASAAFRAGAGHWPWSK